jgi:hypothetical protein
MSVTTTYQCDRCETAETRPEGFIRAYIKTIDARSTFLHPRDHEVAQAIFCRRCSGDLGLKIPRRDEPKPDPEPTLEDMIRAIVQEEVENQ